LFRSVSSRASVIRHFGSVIAISTGVLRITVDEKPKLVTLKLEGRVAGSWVAEFGRTWRSLAPFLDSKKLSLDLREVTQMDAEGQSLLAEIYDKTGAEIQTNSLEMEFCVREVMQEHDRNGTKRSLR
jgi:ABC-type transporter Mla MlaB component